MKHILALSLLLLVACRLVAQVAPIRQDDPPKSYPPMVSQGVFLGNIPALRDLAQEVSIPFEKPKKVLQKHNYFQANEWRNPDALPKGGDPLVNKKGFEGMENEPEIIPGFNIEGLREPALDPPDPTGDVGKHHYVQMVNGGGGSLIQIWDKATGAPVMGPTPSSTIWSQVGTGSIGDPIVQYDHDAERWLIMEMQGFFTTELLIAISDNWDPTGSWKAYRFQTLGFGDYPKLYVWPNAYFITVNEISGGNKCSGYALNRASILAGEPAFDIYRFQMPNYQAIAYQPATGADWEGGPPPPAGSPGYIFRVYDDAWDGGQDHLQVWEVALDWNEPANSNLSGPTKIFTAPFETRVCFGSGLFDCIEQPDPNAPRITALENIIMYRVPYRNFGDYESVVLNHVADVSGQVGDGGDAAVRWYELRKTGGGSWQIHQQGTYAPDLVTNRFMGTLCMDEAGNIGLGYTAASQFLNPGLRLTGRRANDPLGEMTLKEYTLAAGEASHDGSSRWGDYSNMSVDPEDGRTFWFTGEYQPAGVNWGTRVGSFKVQIDTYDIKPIALINPVSSSFLGNGEQVTVSVFNGGLVDCPGFELSLYLDGNFVTTESVAQTLPPGETLEYTFAATVDMPVASKPYKFRIVTKWAKDQFARNDTLTALAEKLTINDAAIVGSYNLPGLVCGPSAEFGVVFRNASGVPLESAKINWRINNQTYQTVDWQGNLLPGRADTVQVKATGILNGLNSFQAFTSMPNGQPDERTVNDSLPPAKFFGNLNGTYLTAEASTESGILRWELRTQNNILLASGELSTGQNIALVCSNDLTCYNFALKSRTFSWQGKFTLLDIYGKVLVSATYANQEEQVFTICTPERKQIDVGAWRLESPKSGPNLTANEPVRISIRNFGLTVVSNPQVSYRMDGGAWVTESYVGKIFPGATAEYTFATTEDLGTQGAVYQFEFKAVVPGDEQPGNDTKTATVKNRSFRDLEVVEVRPLELCGDLNFGYVSLFIKNNGLEEDFQFDLVTTLNGGFPLSQTFFATILPDEVHEITVFVQNMQLGTNILEVDLTNVNGFGEDERPDNDTGSLMFEMSSDGFKVQLVLLTNDTPEQNRWEIRDDQGNLAASGGPFATAFDIVVESICLTTDKCYTFTLFDTGGDGMTGGFVNLFPVAGGAPYWLYEGDNFGGSVSVNFCTQDLCGGFDLSADWQCPTNAAMNNGKITALPFNGTSPFLYALNFGDFQDNPVFENLGLGVYFVTCRDANGCLKDIAVDLCTVGTSEPLQPRKLSVSPNPTSGIANVSLPALPGEQSLLCEVFDAKGKFVQAARLVRWDDQLRGSVALDNQPAGYYLLKTRGGERPLTAVLVKK